MTESFICVCKLLDLTQWDCNITWIWPNYIRQKWGDSLIEEWEDPSSVYKYQLSLFILLYSYQIWKFDTDYKLQQLIDLTVNLEDGEELEDCCFGGQNDEYALAISCKLHTDNSLSIWQADH